MALPRVFTDLVNNLTLFPGVGEKTAERYVYSLCDKEPEEVENLAHQYLLARTLGPLSPLPAEEMAVVIEKFKTYGLKA